jgi:hypothetical protein
MMSVDSVTLAVRESISRQLISRTAEQASEQNSFDGVSDHNIGRAEKYRCCG